MVDSEVGAVLDALLESSELFDSDEIEEEREEREVYECFEEPNIFAVSLVDGL